MKESTKKLMKQSNKSTSIRITRQKSEAKARAKANSEKKSGIVYLKDKDGNVKTGMRLTGKTKVPNLAAMRRKGIITSLD